MPSLVEKSLKNNPGEKSLEAPFAIYIYIECIFKKVQSSQKQPRKILYRKKAKHESSGWSMLIRCSFDRKENKVNYHRGKDCIEKLCKKFNKSANEIINFKKQEKIPLTKKEIKSYEKQKLCQICKKGGFRDDDKDKKKVRDHCYHTGKFRGVAHSECNLRYNTPKEIPVIIHNASYDTHFMLN